MECGKLQNEQGLKDLKIYAQIDWAIDDNENGWHYTKYWDGGEYTDHWDDTKKTWAGFGRNDNLEGMICCWDLVQEDVKPDDICEQPVFRSGTLFNDPDISDEEKSALNQWFYGCEGLLPLKDQLKEGQYTLKETDSKTHDQMLNIDYDEHTAYVRMRWALTLYDKDDKESSVFSSG